LNIKQKQHLETKFLFRFVACSPDGDDIYDSSLLCIVASVTVAPTRSPVTKHQKIYNTMALFEFWKALFEIILGIYNIAAGLRFEEQ